MSYEMSKTIMGEKVDFKIPTPAFYQALGLEGMTKLMYSFYDKIYESDISHFFPQDEEEFAKIKEKNSKFFIQMCGGPKAYDENMNHKDLNQFMIDIHKDFSIYEKSRTEWLGCMQEALEECGIAQELKDDFWAYIEKFSKLTVNSSNDEGKYYASL